MMDIGLSMKDEIILTLLLLIVASVISLIFGFKKRSLLFGLFISSFLGNLILYFDSSSRFYAIYNLKWIVKFTLWYWPWINLSLFILLIIKLLKKKK